jgi:hypothetical protein
VAARRSFDCETELLMPASLHRRGGPACRGKQSYRGQQQPHAAAFCRSVLVAEHRSEHRSDIVQVLAIYRFLPFNGRGAGGDSFSSESFGTASRTSAPVQFEIFTSRLTRIAVLFYNRLPSPRQMQTLVQVWKQLWNAADFPEARFWIAAGLTQNRES